MRALAPRVAAASATLLALLGLSAGSAHGDRIVETVYGAPASYYVPTGYVTTSSAMSLGDAYYVPSSYAYVAPTSYSYVLPASYATTAYSYLPNSGVYSVSPTYYTTSYYRRPGLLRRLASRPVIETTRSYAYDAYPTTYYSPTTIGYDAGLVRTSYAYASPCVETTVPFVPPAAPAAPAGDVDAASKSITSKPKDAGEPAYDDTAAEKAKAAAAAKARPKDAGTSPPDGPVPDKDANGAVNPLDPSNDLPKGPDFQDRRFRPAFKDVQPREGSAARPMLRGEVVSGVTGEAKPNLQVVFSDLNGRFPDRTKRTDAKGTFEVYLPDGGWTVRVVDPAAPAAADGTAPKAKEYGQVTATSGRYLDADDAPIYGLRLSN